MPFHQLSGSRFFVYFAETFFQFFVGWLFSHAGLP
jgi:hypothetical protein